MEKYSSIKGGLMKKPKQFDGFCRKELSKDEEGRVILEAFTMEELWQMTRKFTKVRKTSNRKEAMKTLAPMFDEIANKRLNN